MKRTGPAPLLALAGAGGVAGFLLQTLLASLSEPKLRPEYTLALSLALIGIIVVLLALPVYRSTRSENARKVDPFYATRVVVLAKASSLVGALLGGFGLGLLADLLVRAVAPGGDSVLRVVAMTVGAVLLVAAGLVAEHFCTVPPGDDDDPGGGAAAAG